MWLSFRRTRSAPPPPIDRSGHRPSVTTSTIASADPVRGTMRQLALAAFASAISMRICDPMLPRLGAELDRAVTDLAPIITAFAIAYGAFSLVHGPIGDRYGKLSVIGIASLVAALASLACALASDAATLITLRFVAGAACAAIIPLSLAWIGDSVDFAVRQRTLAHFGAASIAGLIAGQVIGGLAADTLGWRAAFAVPMVLFTIAGSLIARTARRATWTPLTDVATTRGFLAGYAALLRNRWARFLMIAVAFEGALAFGTLAFVPSYLHARFDLPLWHAGLVVAAYGIGGLVFAAGAGRIIGCFGEARMAAAGGAFLAVGFAGIVTAPSWPWTVLGCTAAGFGFTMLHNTLQNQATQAHPTARGTAIAGFALCLFVGQSAGVASAASIGAHAGFAVIFPAFGLLLASLGMIVSRTLARRRRVLADAEREASRMKVVHRNPMPGEPAP